MEDEFVLLTSYFNLAGGRRQDNVDTFRVEPELSSDTSPDGTAALYIVTEASATSQIGTRARRRAADVVLWEYSSRSADPPGPRMKAALRAAHEAVASEFDGHVAVGVSVMAVEYDTVYLGQVAPAQVYVLHEGSLHSIPAEARGNSPFGEAIGSEGGPSIHVFRDELGPGDVVSLCSSWFRRGADAEEIRGSFGGETADDIAETLLDLAKEHDVRDATAIVIETARAAEIADVLTDLETPTFMEQVDAAVEALAGVGKMLWSELRSPEAVDHNGHGASATPQPEPSPAASTPDAASGSEGGRQPLPRKDLTTENPLVDVERPVHSDPETSSMSRAYREQSTDEIPAVRPDELTWETAPRNTREMPAVEPAKAEPEEEQPPWIPSSPMHTDRSQRSRRETRVDDEKRPEPQSVSEMEQVNARIQHEADMGDVIPPVQTFPDTSTEPERIYATSKDIQAVNKRPRRFGGAGRKDGPSGPSVIRPPIGDIDLHRPAGRPAPPAVIWLGIALILIVGVVAAVRFLRKPHSSTPPAYASLVQRDIRNAKQAKDTNRQDAYLAKARKDLALAQANGVAAAKVHQLSSLIQTTADSLHHVVRETSPQLLSDFGKFPNAQPAEIATGPGLIFVLDSNRGVFSVTANATSNPSLLMQQGDSVSGFTVSALQHITSTGSTVLALDKNHVLVRENAGAKTATSLTEGTPGQQYTSLAVSDPDVYVLDPPHNQLWRYAQAVTGFSPAAAAFFSPTTPNLSKAISFAFDSTMVYLLNSDGTVLKFDIMQANPQKFTMPHLRTPLRHPNEIITDRNLNAIYIGDPGSGQIVQFDTSGNFVRTYKSGTSGMDLTTLKSFSVGPAGNTMYVLCDKKLFQFPVTR